MMPRQKGETGKKGGKGGVRSSREVAPSIRRAHGRVRDAWYASLLHAGFLLVLAVYLGTRPEPAWVLAGLCLVGAGAVPLLGRSMYRGNSFSAFLLLASVVAPFVVAFHRGASLGVPLVLLVWGLPYVLGLKGATGLRGRRGVTR